MGFSPVALVHNLPGRSLSHSSRPTTLPSLPDTVASSSVAFYDAKDIMASFLVDPGFLLSQLQSIYACACLLILSLYKLNCIGVFLTAVLFASNCLDKHFRQEVVS